MNNIARLLLATNNQGKILEIKSILQHLAIQLLQPSDLGIDIQVIEDGRTYADNAIKKALAFAKASNLFALADDSGLEVDALNGAPGLRSARYLPMPKATDRDRREFLLSQITGKPRPWTACFQATVAIAIAKDYIEVVEGTCVGEIIPEERGNSGFGYDPIFQLRGLDRTMAELDLDEKNLLSHRGHAVRKTIPILTKIFGL
jgi:XTP/dITP diphosphohydrolase